MAAPAVEDRTSQFTPDSVVACKEKVNGPAPRLLIDNVCGWGCRSPCCAMNTIPRGVNSAADAASGAATFRVTVMVCGLLSACGEPIGSDVWYKPGASPVGSTESVVIVGSGEPARAVPVVFDTLSHGAAASALL